VRESEPARPQPEDAGRGAKAAGAFRTTREVAEALDLPPHVLRFWEARFPQVKPLKRAGGRRYYRPADVELLRRIRAYLYQQGYTIKGVQKLLRDDALRDSEPISAPSEEPEAVPFALAARVDENGVSGAAAALRAALEQLQRDLLGIRAALDGLIRDREPASARDRIGSNRTAVQSDP
jgi:DNA-binding transcriptional MerR regulator